MNTKQIEDGGAAFPIMQIVSEGKEYTRFSIPWSVIAPHEAQAQLNHDQTLKRLAERGGLAPDEAVAILENRRWCRMGLSEAYYKLARIISKAMIAARKGGV